MQETSSFEINQQIRGAQAYGTILVVASAMVFALIALVVKEDPLETVLAAEARFFVCWVIALTFMLIHRSQRALGWFGPAKLRWSLVLRGILTFSFVSLWWAALPLAPLGDCIAVIYCYPIFTVIWSRVILHEQVPAVFPVQALLATIGACFIVQPPLVLKALGLATTTTSEGGSFRLLVAAMIFASMMPIVTRQTREASWIEIEHVANFLAVFVFNPLVFCVQKFVNDESLLALPQVDAWEVGLIILAASGSFAGVAMQTRGYQLAEPGKAGMFAYLEIPFAYLLQLIFTQSPILATSFIGAILVLLSCLLGAIASFRSPCSTVNEVNTQVDQSEVQ